MAAHLTLPEALTVLLLHPDGKLGSVAQTLTVGLGGAVIADLALRGLVEHDRHRLVPVKAPLTNVPVLNQAFEEITASPKHRYVTTWVTRLGRGALRDEVLAGLVQQGVLDRQERRVLGLFPATAYPERDGASRKLLRGAVLDVLEGRSPATPFTAALIGLLHGTGTLRPLFGRFDRHVVARITEGDWIGPAVRSVLQTRQGGATAGAVAGASAAAT